MTFLMTGVALNMAQVLGCLVFFCYLGSIDPNGWMASLMTAFIFFGGLGLRLISEGGGAVGLSLVFVLEDLILGLPIGVLLVFFCRRTMNFWAPSIDVPNIKGRLQVNLCLCIICLLYHFLPAI